MASRESIMECMRLLADATRLRIWLALERERLTVAELQEVLGMGQSRISAQLAAMRRAGLVEDQKVGKHRHYTRREDARLDQFAALAAEAAREIPEARADREAVAHVARKRRDLMRQYFNELAGRFGRDHVPGRSWKSLAELLLKLLPPLVIADLGAGEGTLSQLLAQRAERVIAVDNAENMVEYGEDLARRHGMKNIEYRLGDIEEIPIEDSSVDLAILSQALHHAVEPVRALREAFRILKPGGRVAILDLVQHRDEKARQLYGDVWPGFTEVELLNHLRRAGFSRPEIAIVDRMDATPGFETLLALAHKP